jgi:hypothetical protein
LKIHLINHTSFLILDDNFAIITDPWYDSFAFHSWKSNPPSIYNKELILSILNSKKQSYILISHGHDDHCDDIYLNFLIKNSNAKVLIPEYKSKGFLKRVMQWGGEVIEFKNLILPEFELFSTIKEDFSHDDAIIEIRNDYFYLLHANDNSILFDEIDLDKFRKRIGGRKSFYSSQTNLANGFPYKYLNYQNNMENNVKKKIIKTLEIIKANSSNLKIKNVISYAGYTSSGALLLDNIYSFFPSPKNLNALIKEDLFIDYEVGDVLEVNSKSNEYSISKLKNFLGVDIEKIAKSSTKYINNEYKILEKDLVDKYKKFKINENTVKLFLNSFKQYFLNNLNKFPEEKNLVRLNLNILKNKDVLCRKEINLFETHHDELIVDESIFIKDYWFFAVLDKEVNFESLYIGQIAFFDRKPDIYNHAFVHLLCEFGYVFQKRIIL